jgi:hypothetical protein
VFGINTRFGSLLPSHFRSLQPVHLYKLRLGWASSEREEPRTLGDVRTRSLGPHLRLFGGFREFLCLYSFLLGLHVSVPPRTGANHRWKFPISKPLEVLFLRALQFNCACFLESIGVSVKKFITQRTNLGYYFSLYGKQKLRYRKGYCRATEMANAKKYRPVETSIGGRKERAKR